MAKFREPTAKPDKAKLSDAEKAAKADLFGSEAIPKPPRKKPESHYKRITIPFDEKTYNALVEAAAKADRLPTNFIKQAIKKAIKQGL